MDNNNSNDRTTAGVIAATAIIASITLLALTGLTGSTCAAIDENAEGRDGEMTGDAVPATGVTNSINYQGWLTDSAGSPLSGTYDMTFRLYDVFGRMALATDAHQVVVADGLFNTSIDFDQSYFDGRKLRLGVTVGTDDEMTPRQELRPVPYALSLVPGAEIIGSAPVALYAESVCPKQDNGIGVYGKGKYGGYFTTNQGGAWGQLNHNVAVNATTTHNYSDGFRAYTTGEHSNGVYTFTYGYGSWGVCTHTRGDDSTGVYARTAGDDSDGVYAHASGDRSAGVHALSCESHGIVASTYRADKYGVYTPDKMYASYGYDTSSADVAEYFPTPEDPEPGTVMVIDPAGGSKLRSSTNAYDTTVAGIVSTAPGVSLGTNGDGNDGEKLIAVAGRVPCKVDASYAPITPGDLLTTSDTPGHAMKAQPVEIGGIEIYRPGTAIGKALEPFGTGTGTIEVLVTLQ